MYLGNVYGMLANAILLLAIAIVVIVTDRIKIRQYEREIVELEYELEKYEQYDDEEKRTETDEYEVLKRPVSKSYDLSKDPYYKEH